MGKKFCNHKWEDIKVITLNLKSGASVPRRIQKCKKCGAMIHVPIYTLSQLAEKELAGVNNV